MKRVDKLNEHIKSSEQALEEQRRLRAELQVSLTCSYLVNLYRLHY